MPAPTPAEISAEMRKIVGGSPKSPKSPKSDCSGHCNGGDTFVLTKPDAQYDNTIHFKSRSTGQEFAYPAKETGSYEMNFEKANDVFDCWFSSSHSQAEFLVRVVPGGKRINVEDQGTWGDMDFTDLIISCEEGTFANNGDWTKDLTFTSGSRAECPNDCDCVDGACVGEPDPCEGVDCPECHECRDGDCHDLCPDQYCVDNGCVDCRDDNDCDFGFICENGECIPGCRGDDGCQPWEECVNGECQDRCPDVSEVWNGEECICANEFVEVNDICQPQCPPRPPVEGDGDCESTNNNPCHGVTCIPPRTCVDGSCVCPAGMIDAGNGLCVAESGDEACATTYCPPNSTCQDGLCLCDEGYVKDPNGWCVMAETPDCEDVPAEDCCPSNSTIELIAGDGLGGGGSFTLNQSEDKTIIFWLDKSEEDEECNELGQAEVCTCTHELAQLMEVVLTLKKEIQRVKQEQIDCLEFC